MPWTILSAVSAFRQLPCPVPPEFEAPPPLSSFEQLILCFLLVGVATAWLSFFLPRPLFCKLLRIAFPFLPERLEDFDEEN
jgi:hypothetical protein